MILKPSFISLFLILLMSYCSIKVYSQVNGNKQSIQSLLQKIEKKERLNFSYEQSILTNLDCPAYLKTWKDLEKWMLTNGFRTINDKQGSILIAAQTPLNSNKDSIRVKILDKKTPLVGATLLSKNGNGFSSNNQGEIKLPSNILPQNFTVRYLGYATKTLMISSNKNGVIINMTPEALPIYEAIIIAPLAPKKGTLEKFLEKKNSTNPSLNLLPISTKSLSSAGFYAIAGVNGIGENAAVPAIRGSKSNETLIEIDKLPLYNVNHLYGTFSAINEQYVEDIAIYRTHYPANYGGFTGGLLQARSNNIYKNRFQVNINPMELKSNLELRKEQWTGLISGRTTLGNISQTSFFTSTIPQQKDTTNNQFGNNIPKYRFNDLFAKINWQGKNQSKQVSLCGFISNDITNLQLQNTLTVPTRNNSTRNISYLFNQDSKWNSYGTSLSAKHAINSYTQLLINGHLSNYEQSLNNATTLSGFRRPARTIEENELINKVNVQQVEIEVNRSKNSYTLASGLQLQQLNTIGKFYIGRGYYLLDQNNKSTRLHAYSTFVDTLKKNWIFDLGIRYTNDLSTSNHWLSPRFGIVYSLNKYSIFSNYSYTRQAIQSIDIENQFGQIYNILLLNANNKNTASSANNISLGAKYIASNYRISVEAYYRNLSNVLETINVNISDNNTGFDDIRQFTPTFRTLTGEAGIKGIDVDFGIFHRGFEGIFSYTLSKNQRRFKALYDNQWLPSSNDRRHRFTASSLYRTKHWEFNLNYEGASGTPYNNTYNIAPDIRRELIDPNIYINYLPNYHRFDLSVDRIIRQKSPKLIVGGKIYNVFNRNNVSYRQYVVALDRPDPTNFPRNFKPELQGADISLLPRTYLLELKIEF